jgi:hypothetical protein
VVQKLVENYNRINNSSCAKPSIAIGYVDVRNDNTSDQPESTQEQVENLANTVPSEIDWSEVSCQKGSH